MRFIASADWHIPGVAPRNRKDDYFETVMGKLEFILDTASTEANNVLVVAGDIFDTSKVSNNVIRRVIKLLREYNVEIFAVPGQHDMIYHTQGMNNTPLALLEAAECITILNDTDLYFPETYGEEIAIYGAGWEAENNPEMGTGRCNIILAHTLVTKSGPLFPGQTDFISAEGICKKYPDADFIISGDNHKPHVHVSDACDNININCGSIVRKNKDQMDYRPAIWLCDTEEGTYEQVFIYTEPAEDVFDLGKIELDEKKDESKKHLEALVTKLSDKDSNSIPDFKEVLKNVTKEAKPSKAVEGIVNSVMEKVG